MGDLRASDEREPLLHRSAASSASILSSTSKASDIGPDAESNEGQSDNPAISTSRGILIASFIGLLIFLQATNISILTTTQSSIAEDLDAFEKASWLTSSYLIAMSSLAPLMGRLSQVFSARLCMFTSTVIICIGSIITSTSVSFEMFMVGRTVTGAGAGGIFIVASIIAVQMSSPKHRGLYIGLVNTSMTVGVSLGAVIAGALEPTIGWKPLFGIQAPVSILAGIGLLYALPTNYIAKRTPHVDLSLKEKLARIDYSGALLLIVTIVLFLLGLSGPRILPLPLILSAFALPLFVLNEIYIAKEPIIPVSVLRSRGTLLTCLAAVGFMMARWLVLFYSPMYALAVRGWKPAVAGSILIPTNAGFASGGILAGVFHIRRNGSFYIHSVVSMALFPVTMIILAFISTAQSNAGLYVVMVFLNGLITGGALNYALVHMLHLTLPEVHPIVLSLLATFRGFAGSFGSAIGGGVFSRVLYSSLVGGFKEAGLKHKGTLIRRLLGSPALVYHLEGVERDIAIHAYEKALRALFIGGVGLSIIVVIVQAGTGWKEPAKTEEEISVVEEESEQRLASG